MNTIAILDRLVGRVIEQAEEISDLRRELADATAEPRLRPVSDDADLRPALENLRASFARVTAERDRLAGKLAELATVADQRDAASARRDEAFGEIEHLRRQLAEVTAERDAGRRTGLELRTERDVARAELDAARAELDEERAANERRLDALRSESAERARAAQGVPKFGGQRVSFSTDQTVDPADYAAGREVASPDLTGCWTVAQRSTAAVAFPGRWVELHSTTREYDDGCPVRLLVPADGSFTLTEPMF